MYKQDTPRSWLKDSLVVLLLLFIAMVSVYFYTNKVARLKAWKALYPVRAQIALMQQHCEGNDNQEWLKEVINKVTKSANAPSNQMVYISPEGDISQCNSGYMDKPLISEPIDSNTRYRYASITKVFTADVILDLIKSGQLSFDTSLVSILNLPVPKDPRVSDITIGHLLQHQGGFDRRQFFSETMFAYNKEPLCPNHLERLAETTLNFTPGEKTVYSNLGYCLLGEVIKVLNNKPYQAVMEEKYALAEKNMQFVGQSRLSDEVNYNHINLSLTLESDYFSLYDFSGLASTAGLSGTALELAKTIKVLIQKPPPNILSQSTSQQCNLSLFSSCYGYAMDIYQRSPDELFIYFKTGNLEGLSTLVIVDEYGGVTVLLSNGVPDDGKNSLDAVKLMIYKKLSFIYKEL